MLKRGPLWSVQSRAIEFALEHPSTMLNMAMGTGKTRSAIEILERTRSLRTLVIAPKSVVPVWRTEITRHSDISWWDILELGRGPVKRRAETLQKFLEKPLEIGRAQMIVVSYDVIWREPLYALLCRVKWDTVLLDESHRAKSHSSRTSKACAKIGRGASRRLCLSGTPMANSPLDVYGQYRFLDPTIFGTSWTRFVDEYGVRGGPERRFIVGHKNLDRLGQRFHSIAFSCTKEDIQEEAQLLGPPDSTFRVGEMVREARRVYSELERDFVADWRSGMIVTSNVLVRMLRFQQITSGFVEVTDIEGMNPVLEHVDRTKSSMLKEVLEDLPMAEPVVVFYKFRTDAKTIRGTALSLHREAFELSGNANDIEAWRKSSGGVLAVQYQSGAVGVDLTHASYAIYYSLPFSLAEYQQSQARVYRPGQTRPVTLLHLLIENSIDETIMNALENKANVIERVLATGQV